jgi:glutamyl-tRNA(Gln) amidotransferase subunit E
MDYSKIGLKSGIEIHQQLEGKKLFCNCPTLLRDDEPDFVIKRKLRAVAGESGKIDIAAKQEQIRDKTFVYQGYHNTTCLVETDSEPPHEMNKDALYTILQLSKLVDAHVSPIVQVMRKTVVDGSNTSGFQRTALVSRNGAIETSEGVVRIDNISLEEDACKIISETSNERVWQLDRLGIPLIEIGTAPDIKTPKQCQEVSKKLGMLLRSLPGVKRGLGTIRQDVNISIKGGSRIEVKGFQDLRMIPKLVELEVKRQMELLKIKEELSGKKLNSFEISDLTKLLSKSESKVIVSAFKDKGKVMALKLEGFKGMVGRELQPNHRVGSEFSGRAKIKAGVRGIFHSDELPNYGITEEEVKLIKKELKCSEKDAFVLVAAAEDKCKIALSAVYERTEELFTGVPKEVRKDNPDGTTTFMRPIPGAARMYPETDVPMIKTDPYSVEVPELISEKAERYQKKFGLSFDLAEYIAKSDYVELFEDLVKKYPKFKANFIADTLISMPKEINKKYQLDASKLNSENYKDLFKHLDSGAVHKDIVIDVLIDMIKGKFNLKNYETISDNDISEKVKEIVSANKGAPMGALMGLCMKALAGKASGKVISEELKKLVN